MQAPLREELRVDEDCCCCGRRAGPRDELALGRSIHVTPVEYVRGVVEVYRSPDCPRGRPAVYFNTRDYDDQLQRLYKTQLT